jgi:hypothetical protein
MTAAASNRSLRRTIPWLWLAMSLLWAVVIIFTDQLAWPLALWIATTLGPLTYLRSWTDQSAAHGPHIKEGNQ